MTQKKQLMVTRPEALSPDIALGLSMLDMARQRTLSTVQALSTAALDREVNGHTIGSLLYHIALIELDWLYSEVKTQEYPAWATDLFPVDHRTADGQLSRFAGETAEQHFARLDSIRKDLLDTYQTLTPEDFRSPRNLPHYEVTPEWVLLHLAHHEARHFGQIENMIRIADLKNL